MPALTPDLIAASLPPARQPRRAAPTTPERTMRADQRGALAGRPRAGEAPLRLFAYGALMWEREAVPGATAVEPARLGGFACRWCLRDVHNRGTPEVPGLTLGLEPAPGGWCEGLLFTLPREPAGAEEAALWPAWRHEMAPGFYRHAWVPVAPRGGPPAWGLIFVADEGHPLYAGDLPEAEQVGVLARAVGPQGPGAEYLRKVVETLAARGMEDAPTRRLAGMVAGRLRGA